MYGRMYVYMYVCIVLDILVGTKTIKKNFQKDINGLFSVC